MNKLKKTSLALILTLAYTTSFSNEYMLFVKPLPKHNSIQSLRTSAIIEIFEDNEFKGIILIDRGNHKALPEGKIHIKESVEDAICRRIMKISSLELRDLKQFHIYSNPEKNLRHYFIRIAFLAKAYQRPQIYDSSLQSQIVALENIPWNEIAVEHVKILLDYIDYRRKTLSTIMIKP